MLSFQGIIVEILFSFDVESQKEFNKFQEDFKLTAYQAEQFKKYLELLKKTSTLFNITAILSLKEMIESHLRDSLALVACYDLNSIKMMADVGTGGGISRNSFKDSLSAFECYIDRSFGKKREFLNTVIQTLHLQNIETSDLDWRTFLRKTSYPIDLFVARASLHTDELIRIFQPACSYKHAFLVYWASRHWQIGPKEQPFFWKECDYMVQNKQRKLVFFKPSINISI